MGLSTQCDGHVWLNFGPASLQLVKGVSSKIQMDECACEICSCCPGSHSEHIQTLTTGLLVAARFDRSLPDFGLPAVVVATSVDDPVLGPDCAMAETQLQSFTWL